jgi:N-acetyl-anhydromuramyl-L-alanine amidase AmpD
MLYQVTESPDKRERRESSWIGICIHHTAINDKHNTESAFDIFTKNIIKYLTKKDDNFVSAHYLIDRRGVITQLVDERFYESFHAGKSFYWHPGLRKKVKDWNRYSIGIELIGNGNILDYTESQYSSLIQLCRYLIVTHPTIHPHCIVGHEMICEPEGRKVDPGSRFNWRKLFNGIYA